MSRELVAIEQLCRGVGMYIKCINMLRKGEAAEREGRSQVVGRSFRFIRSTTIPSLLCRLSLLSPSYHVEFIVSTKYHPIQA